MHVREAYASQFYAGDCARSAESFVGGFSVPTEPAQAVAGIVPHAAWQYSGAVAAKVFLSIRAKSNPQTFIIFGAVHRWAGINSIDVRGAWATPLGNVEIDSALAEKILSGAAEWIVDDPGAHSQEHSIEVELPFIKHFFPQAQFVPIAVNPDDRAVPLGKRLGEIVKDCRDPIVIIGSTDLTHYGDAYRFTPAGYGPRAYRWMHENDARILQLAEEAKAEEIVAEASQHRNACGAGAMAATIAAARALGAERGYKVEYTTSFEVSPEDEFQMAVGYAGLLY